NRDPRPVLGADAAGDLTRQRRGFCGIGAGNCGAARDVGGNRRPRAQDARDVDRALDGSDQGPDNDRGLVCQPAQQQSDVGRTPVQGDPGRHDARSEKLNAVILYLSIAIVASVLMALGLLMMKSRSAHLPLAAGANAIGAIAAWIRDPMWIGGLGVQTVGWALYVIAVSRAPVSMVAVMMQGGIALFVIASVVILGERATGREWVGIGAIVFGMLMLTLSLQGGEIDGAFEPGTLLTFSALLTVAGLAPMAVARLNASGAAAAILSGVAFGLGGLFTKAMT